MSEIETYQFRKIREDFDVTQTMLAEATTLSIKTISRADRGEPLSPFAVKVIREYFSKLYGRQVSLEDLGLKLQKKSRTKSVKNDDTNDEEEYEEIATEDHPQEMTRTSPIDIPHSTTSSQNIFTQSFVDKSEVNTPINENKNATVIVLIQEGNVSTIQLPTVQEVIAINTMAQNQRNNAMVDQNKRNTLKLGAATASTYFLASQATFNADILDRLEKFFNKSSNIDTTTLDILQTFTQNSWQLIPDVAGNVSIHSLHYILEHLQKVTGLLEESHSTPIHRQLCSFVSELALAAGIILRSMQDSNGARRHYKISTDAARESGNHELQAVGLARISLSLIDENRTQEALVFIEEARQLAINSATHTTLAWIAAIEAEAQVKNFDPNGPINDISCLRALEQAETIRGGVLTPEQDPYHTTFNSFMLAGYKAVCFTRLKKLNKAKETIEEALATPNFPSLYLKSSMLTDLASIYIQQGEIEEGCKLATQALIITKHTKIPTMRQYLHDFKQQLEPWKNTQTTKDFNEQLSLIQ